MGVFFSQAQTNYFYKGSGSITTTTNWGSNTNGSGSAPANFSNGDIFNLRNITTIPTLTTNWTVSGTNAKVIVGDGTNTCTLSIPSGFTITATINISNNATLSIANATNPTLGVLASGSTVNFSGSVAQTIPSANYFNLISSSSGARILVNAGNIGVAGTFTRGSNSYTTTGSTVVYNGNAAQTLASGTFDNLSITNTLGTVTAGGNITVNNVFTIIDAAIVDMGTYVFNCGGVQYSTNFSTSNGGGSGTGKLTTKNTSGSGAINSNYNSYTWNFTVEYAASSAQTTSKGTQTYINLISNNNSATGVSLYTGAMVTGTLTINAGCTLSVGSSQTLSGNFNTTGTGILSMGNTSSTPLPSGVTYSFDVYYNSTSSQTIMGGKYNALLNTSGGNRAFSLSSTDTIYINSTFTTGSGTFSANNSTVYFSGNRTLPNIPFYNLVLGTGTFNSPSSLTVAFDLTILSIATFNAPSGSLFVGDDFFNYGIFNHNNGSVVFNGSSQYVFGNTTFFNFTKSVTVTDIITFQSNSTQTIQGKLTLKGASGNLLSVYSSSVSSQASINPSTISSNLDIGYVAVSGMNNTSASTITAANSQNYGNNTNWNLGTPSATGDLETVPASWSTTNGTLVVDTSHYRLGSRSVGWKWNANDTLKITGIGFDSSWLFNYNYNTMDVSIYNTSQRNDSIQFLFYNRNKVLRYYFSVRLNYNGWYQAIRSYRYNMYKPVGSNTTDSLMTVFIVAPKSGNGQLDFDRVNWITSRQSTPMTLMMPDSIIKTGASYPIYDDNIIYTLPPNVNVTAPTAKELTDFNSIKTAFLNDIKQSASSIATTSNLSAANSFYSSNGYTLNSDGTAKGKIIYGYPQGASGNFVSFTKYLQIFAYKWTIDNSDTISLNKAIVMLRYYLDNGSFGGGCYKIGNYDALEFYTSLAVMADKIYTTDTILYYGLANALKWQLRFGAAWMPASIYSPLTTDNPREEITGYLTYPLFYLRDNATAIQHLKGFNQLLNIFMTPNDGIEDNIKVDGSAFHHGAHYYGYVEPCYSNVPYWIYHLRNTVFKPDSVTYKRIRDVAYLYFIQSNTFNPTYGNKAEAQASSYYDSKFSRLANLGRGITGNGPDYRIGCAYNRLFPNKSDTSLPTTTYPAEPFPSGFYQMNYATLGIYRQKNWLSTIKMLSQDFWGSECGLVGDNGTRRDIYSRYLGYGSIDVQYPGGFDSSGYSFDIYKYTNGYDHRFPNGATTIVLPMDSLAQNESYGKEYGNTGSIAASLSFNNRKTDFSFKIGGDYGLSAMSFRQAPYGFQGGCKGTQRDTNFVFQKSWFAFDSIIVCLGSGIKNKQANYKTATSIFQLIDSAQTLYINGTANNTFNYKNDLIGTGPYKLMSPYNTGYYIKSNDSLHISVTKQAFSLNINGTYAPSTGNWANAWLDHGKAPVNKGYEYVILPSTTPALLNQFADSMANPISACYIVKRADSVMHYVYYKPLKIQAFAIFKTITNYSDTSSFINSVSNPCYAMCMNVGDTQMKCTFVNPDPNLQTSSIPSSFVLGQYIDKSTLTPLTITLRGRWQIKTADTSIQLVSTTDSTTQILINTQYSLPNDVVLLSNKKTTWNGLVWNYGIPDKYSDAIINGNWMNNSNLSMKSLSINNGFTINNTGNIRIVTSNLTNNGTINGNGNVELNGSSTQSILGKGKITNLTINNPNGVTLTDSLYIVGTLTPTAGTINTNGLLVLTSTPNATAQIAAGTGNYLNGNVTVERFIPNKTARKYSFVASPISQTIRNAWQKQIYITGSGNGGQPCGSTAGNGGTTDRYNSNGFDKTVLNTPSMYIYQTSPGTNGSRWTTISNTNATNLEIGKGYRINIRGNRNSTINNCNNQLNSNTPTAPEEVTLASMGTINTGSVMINLNNPTTHLYSLVGNPYPCPISFSALFVSNTANINNKMWTYSPFSNGSYTTYANGLIANPATGFDNTNGDYIASGQAFFVESKLTGNGTITFEEQLKTLGQIPNNQYFGNANKQLLRIALQANDSIRLDETVVRLNNVGSKNYHSDWDAISMGGGTQSIAVKKKRSYLSIATYPESTLMDTIQLFVNSNKPDAYQLAFSHSIDSTVDVTLLDHFLGTETTIHPTTKYSFNITSDTNSWGERRFAIVLKKQSVVLPLSFVQASVQILDRYPFICWKTSRNVLIKEFIVEKSSNGVDFKNLYRTNQTEFIDTTSFSSLAYYRIAAQQTNGEIGYSNIVSIRSSTMELPSFQLFPNPMVGTNSQLKLIHVEAGKYRLAVIDNLGKSVLESAIVHEGGTAVFPILLRPYLSKGIYQIRIQKQGEVGIIFHQNLVIL